MWFQRAISIFIIIINPWACVWKPLIKKHVYFSKYLKWCLGVSVIGHGCCNDALMILVCAWRKKHWWWSDRLTFPALITFSAAYTDSPQRAHFSEPPNFCANLDGFGLVVGRWVWVLVGHREVRCCFLERSLTRSPEWVALCRASMKRVQELCLHNRFFHNNNHLTASPNTPEDGFMTLQNPLEILQ